MSTTRKIRGLILRIVLAVVILGLALFVVGFIAGYVVWFPEFGSRVMHAFHAGLFLLCASLILDPILIVRLISHFSKKRRDSPDAS